MGKGRLKTCPITSQQRAAMRAAQAHVARVLQQGCSVQELAQARANIDALSHPRQQALPLLGPGSLPRQR